MSDPSADPTKGQVPPEPAPDAAFMKKFEDAIVSWAELNSTGKPEEIHAASCQLMSMVIEERLRNPDPEVLVMDEADDLERKGDWQGAEALHRKLLAVKQESGNFGWIAKMQMDLCQLLRAVGRYDEAWEFACAATEAARRWEATYLLLVMALLCKSGCASDRGDSANALAAASEAVALLKPEKLTDKMRAKALTARAKSLLARGDTEGAGLDLTAGWELLDPDSGPFMVPGEVFALANWWEVESEREERRGNHWQARDAIARSIEYRRQLPSPYALVTLARSLARLAGFLTTFGDEEGAFRASSESKSIREALHLPVSV
jgi:tetratricopeptide (TPR) repeat protein